MAGINPFARKIEPEATPVKTPKINAWQFIFGVTLSNNIARLPPAPPKSLSKRAKRRARGRAKGRR